jgi:hypothetical protein
LTPVWVLRKSGRRLKRLTRVNLLRKNDKLKEK